MSDDTSYVPLLCLRRDTCRLGGVKQCALWPKLILACACPTPFDTFQAMGKGLEGVSWTVYSARFALQVGGTIGVM